MSDPGGWGRAPARVLMTADTIGGVWTYALDLMRSLAPRGVEFTLATMGRPLTSGQRAATAGRDVRESAFRLEWMEEPWTDVEKAGEWLLDLEREVQPDLVHLNGFAHGALPWRSPVLVVAHSCVLSWWRAVKRQEAPPRLERYRAAVTAGLRAADLVVAPTRAMLATLTDLYGPFAGSAVVSNGRDPGYVLPLRKEPFVLCAGRLWDEAKNLSALERAAPGVPWPIYAAGETSELPGAALGRPSSIRRLGRLAPGTLASWLARAAIFAAPARYEPFGLAVLEAALAGCALVLGDIASLRENWDGVASFVDPEDVEALGFALRSLCHDAPARGRSGEQARGRALAMGLGPMAEGYLEAYFRLLLAPRGWRQHACAS